MTLLVSRYRKKPLEVDAVLFGYPNTYRAVAKWCGGKLVRQNRVVYGLEIPTIEGTMTALRGDWIVRGTQGEFYPVKPWIFAELYEAPR